MTGLQRRHWIASMLLAIGIHLLAAAALLWQKPQDGARSPGIGGIEIALGTAGGAPGAVAAAVPEPATQDAPPEDAPAADAPPAETSETAPENPEPLEEPPMAETAKVDAPIEPAPPIAEPAPPAADALPAADAPPEPVSARSVAAPPPPKRKPRPPKPARMEREPPQETAPTPPAEFPTGPVQTQQAASGARTASAPSAQGAAGKAGARDSPNAGDTANDASAGGMAGATADYMSLLQAWLEKHKEYPHRAQSRRQQGTALLYFVMNREGDVLDFKLRKSSGYRLLDREVLAMIERAQPLPRIPDEMGKERMELVVPVQFFIR